MSKPTLEEKWDALRTFLLKKGAEGASLTEGPLEERAFKLSAHLTYVQILSLMDHLDGDCPGPKVERAADQCATLLGKAEAQL